MFRLDCVIKCVINGILLLLPALYFFCICVCLHLLCIKVNRKQVWGKHTVTTKRVPTTKIMKLRKQWTKYHARQSWTKTGPRVGRPASYMGQLAQPSTTSPRASSTTRFESHMIYFHMFRFLFRFELKIL